ncbi:cob(I)yrinic acid a,c-diamide adenosyltransferase [Paraneptunicella aestuarii]|uniref:cob(I)yrinic acid a,c-diamide adenosyltransferase n=1 Tax=Paraneptunicella aestuarii TaxID=2831148 RepID=UPI001E59942F|nr:cob(I)yrinic acid a,c-diamide adenosyltransferase [Paraneptunicella aestuarii]UAA37756.1 cob(I)yrinic acid a,c-diamide adenosyltransferase [Paraneptunicella aestuarii]
MNSSSSDERHKQRMQKLKEKVDARIESATEDKGLLLVLTGNGKGKSSSGFGMVARAVGHGLKAAVAQFIKGSWECGERNLLEKAGVAFEVMRTGFTWDTQDKTADTEAAQAVWQHAKQWLQDDTIDVVMLDEITYMLTYQYLDLDEVLSAIANRPVNQHVIVTGRACHRALIELADTVSEVNNTKHAFDAGVKAQKGIDW